MTRFLLLLILSFSTAVFAVDSDESDISRESSSLQLTQLPEGVLAAAQEAKPDVYFKQAERVWWRDEPAYRIIGSQYRRTWSVYVTSQGDVVRISSDMQDGNGR